jgi:phage-related tail protein
MATESELKQEIADERRRLTNAVADLRQELGNTAERGKKLASTAGAAAGAAFVLTRLLRLRRKQRD